MSDGQVYDKAAQQRLNEELRANGLAPIAPEPFEEDPNHYVFPVAAWIQDPEFVLAEVRRYVTRFIGERSTGSVGLEFHNTSKESCVGDTEEHACAKRTP